LAPGRRGLPLLEEVLAVSTPGPLPGSPAEMRLVRRLASWGFPLPERQLRVLNERGVFLGRVDLGWSDRRVAFEYDGAEAHTPRQWASDEARLRPSSTRLRELLTPLLARRRAA